LNKIKKGDHSNTPPIPEVRPRSNSSPFVYSWDYGSIEVDGWQRTRKKKKKKKKDNLNNVKEQDSDDRSEDRSEEDVLRNISVDEDAIKASRKISNTRKTMTIYDNDTIYHNAPKYREETDITDIISSKSKKR